MSRWLALLTLSTLTATVTAQAPQDIRFFGTVVTTATGYGLEGLSVSLESSTVDLSLLVGENLDMTGTATLAGPPSTLEVAAAAPAQSWLSIGAARSIGDTLELTVTDPAALFQTTLFSRTEGFTPLSGLFPGADGTLFLASEQVVSILFAEMQGSSTMLLPIPASPLLVGVEVLFQSAVIHRIGEALAINAQRLVIADLDGGGGDRHDNGRRGHGGYRTEPGNRGARGNRGRRGPDGP